MDVTTASSSIGQAQRRLMRDLRDLNNNKVDGIMASPVSVDNIFLWNAVITGVPDTAFELGSFFLTMKFSEQYPNVAPEIRFVTKIFHPNIYQDGAICLDILQNRWSASLDISSILISIRSLLSDPNPNSPANSEAATLFRDHRRDYERRVREYVEQSWEIDNDETAEKNNDETKMVTSETTMIEQQQE